MKSPSITLRRSLDVTLSDTFRRINDLSGKDGQSLKDEYKEWIDAMNDGETQPHVLYMNQI